ncbi:MAG TPA: ABC transporter permease [Actinomycetota bacterium]|nr:ABC transporter permease [Actinomycetota bacterium]
MRALIAQTRMELVMSLRQYESLFVTIFIPSSLLIFLTKVELYGLHQDRLSYVFPGVLSIALRAVSMVSLGIATGFERRYGVLKRLAMTPLSKPALVASKMAAVSLILVLQVTVLTAAATALSWRPTGVSLLPLILGLVLGTSAFAGLGLALAGSLKAELNLALLNGLFVVMLMTGGAIFPLERLPFMIEAVVRFLPLHLVTEMLRAGLSGGEFPGGILVVLLVWAIVMPILAAKTFSWE